MLTLMIKMTAGTEIKIQHGQHPDLNADMHIYVEKSYPRSGYFLHFLVLMGRKRYLPLASWFAIFIYFKPTLKRVYDSENLLQD